MRRTLLGIAAAALAGVCVAQAAKQIKKETKSHGVVAPDAVKWGPPAAYMVSGPPPADFANEPPFQVAIIAGDPSKAGAAYTIRIKAPDGLRVAPHWHPQDENLTTLSGTFVLGMGDKFDKAGGMKMPAGAYGLVPKGMHHFGWCEGESVVQVYGTGPFKINWVGAGEGAKGKAKPKKS